MDIRKEEVEKYLTDVKKLVRVGRYRVSSRKKNRELFVEYVFTEDMRKEVLLSLTAEDFSDAVRKEHPEHPEEILYIFGKDISLVPRFGGKEETVSLYIKFNKLENLYIIVISFHKQEYPLKYKFTAD